MSGPTKLQVKLAQKFGKKKGINPSDLLDIIKHESNFDPLATEHGGTVSNTPSEAQGGGLTQFITSTARSYDVEYGASKHAQKTQIRGAARYLKDLGWGGGSPAEIQKALAGYYGAASPYAADVINSDEFAKYDNFKGGLKNLAGTSAGASSSKTKSKTKKVQTQPAVSNEAARAQSALAFIRDEDKDFTDYLNFTATQESLQDVPAQYKTKTVKTKGKVDPAATATKGAKSVKGGPQLQGGSSHEIVQIGKWAEKKFGLSVGENPKFGGVAPVHATNSFHYSARAIDVSGDAEAMRKFAHAVAKRYGPKLAEMFWQGAGGINYDNGQPVAQGYVSGHTDHVHVAI